MRYAVAAALVAGLWGPAQAQEWVPNAHHAIGVHWVEDDLAKAQKQFEDWGFKGIRSFDRYRFSGEHNCSKARDVAEGAAVTREEGCYYYKDGGIFAQLENNCQLYQFDFESYEGSDHGDGHHPRDCRAKGPGTGR